MNREYNNIARFYDSATAWFMSGVRSRITADIHGGSVPGRIPRQDVSPFRVLDIGCGTGRQLLALRASGLLCAGADNSPEMLAVAAKLLGEADAGRSAAKAGSQQGGPAGENFQCPLTLANADRLPFQADSFDAALLSLILHESESDPLEILREAVRVAPSILVLEWKMAERNLDYLASPAIHLIERLAGRRHYQRFRAFMRQGGLEGLIQRFNLQAAANGSRRLEPVRRTFLRFGSLILMNLKRQ